MNVARGEVVLVDFPFAGGSSSKVRPALVVQNDRDNRRLTNAFVSMRTLIHRDLHRYFRG